MAGSDYDEGRLGFEFQLLELSGLDVKFYQTLNFLPIAFNNIIIVVVAANIHNPGYGDFFGTLLSSSSSSPSTYTTRIVEKEKRPWSINYWRSFYTAAPVTWLPSIYYLWTTPWRRIYRENIPLHCENHIENNSTIKTTLLWRLIFFGSSCETHTWKQGKNFETLLSAKLSLSPAVPVSGFLGLSLPPFDELSLSVLYLLPCWSP